MNFMRRYVVTSKIGEQTITLAGDCCSFPGQRNRSQAIHRKQVAFTGYFYAAGIYFANINGADLLFLYNAVVVHIAEQPQPAFAPAPAKPGAVLQVRGPVIGKTRELIDILLVAGRQGINSGTVEISLEPVIRRIDGIGNSAVTELFTGRDNVFRKTGERTFVAAGGYNRVFCTARKNSNSNKNCR